MKEKLISVIIPTYNRSNLIKDTIYSVLNQTYQNFEIIIVDDGSTDDTEIIVKSISDNRIKYVKQKNTEFPSIARNNGLRIVKGDYVAFLDSDDLWFPKKLEKQIKAFDNNENIFLVSSNGLTFPNVSKILSIKENKIICFRELLEKNIVGNSSVLMKREIIDKIGYLDENKKLKALEDYDYWLRILYEKDYSILILKDLLIKYRIHEANISHYTHENTLRLLRSYIGIKYIFNKFLECKVINIESIFKNKTRPLKLLIFKNLYLKNKRMFLFKDPDISFLSKFIVLITYFYKKHIKLHITIDLKKVKFIGKLLKRIYFL